MENNIENKIDQMIEMLVDHGARLSTIEEKVDDMVSRDEFLGVTDEIMTVVRRLDENNTFQGERIKRIEKTIEVIPALKAKAGAV